MVDYLVHYPSETDYLVDYLKDMFLRQGFLGKCSFGFEEIIDYIYGPQQKVREALSSMVDNGYLKKTKERTCMYCGSQTKEDETECVCGVSLQECRPAVDEYWTIAGELAAAVKELRLRSQAIKH